MEKSIAKHLDDVMTQPGVVGVACTDNKGLCVGVRGVAKKTSAGLLAGLAQQARALHPELKDDPVICVEDDMGSILVKSQDDVTFAIHKSAS